MLRDFTKDELDIVVQAGQSNSQDAGLGSVSKPFEPSYDIWYFTSDFIITVAQELAFLNYVIGNYSTSFASEYVSNGLLKDGRKMLIVRAGFGGTGFTHGHWIPEGKEYKCMIDMIDTALSLNPTNKLVAFLWQQGEADALAHSSYDAHVNYLTDFI